MEGRFPLLRDAFAEMRVHTTHGKVSLPSDYKGERFVVFSHPADFTPVCTTEFVAFQKRYGQVTDHVIVPATTDAERAKKHLKEYECFRLVVLSQAGVAPAWRTGSCEWTGWLSEC